MIESQSKYFSKFHEDQTKIVDFYQFSIFEFVLFLFTQALNQNPNLYFFTSPVLVQKIYVS